MMLNEAEAHIEGKALLAKMTTPGWSYKVWENLGWHAKVSKGNMHVHYSEKGNYLGMLSPTGGGGCSNFWYDDKRFSDPNEAVEHRLSLAQAFIDECQACVSALT